MAALMTAAEVRDMFPTKLPEDKYPTPLLEGFIGSFSQVVRAARGWEPAVSSQTEQRRSDRHGSIRVSRVPVVEVTALSWLPTYVYVDTIPTVVDGPDLDAVNLALEKEIGRVHGVNAPEGSLVTITYTHGATPPPDAKITCAEYVRARATRMVGNKPRNSNPDSLDDLPYRENIADPANDRWTGMPVVDNAIAAWPDRRIPGLA